MTEFWKNNLDKASSPYLQQHKDNPIHWQEWSNEAIKYSKNNDKIIFVSVGYSTCHWCHVMAHESFDDKEVAEYLNKNFVSIKVDREQRPDIDSYLMNFIVNTQGTGGWPLNAFFTPELKPILALTYVPASKKYGMPAFIEVLKTVKQFYEKGKTKNYQISINPEEEVDEEAVIDNIFSSYDEFAGGFGVEQKFPPHNTLLFLLNYYEHSKDKKIKDMVEKTLDMISMKGLNDHLQGGFFRYCTDPAWTIPHFEKMLYDQAMHLWVYSLAYKILKKQEYKTITEKIIKCLEESFEDNGLFYSSHDADTEKGEGKAYLWKIEEIKNILNEEEYKIFSEVYELDNNLEDKLHLIKKNMIFIEKIEGKLLEFRKKLTQPFVDKKIITSWNCILGIAFIINYRFTNNIKPKDKALNIFKKIVDNHYKHGRLSHSSINLLLQEGEFLEDYAALLLFTTYIYEETNNNLDFMKELADKIQKFRNNNWIESDNADFMKIPAQDYDHPYPSSISLAEMALLKYKILLGEVYPTGNYKQSVNHDFYNLSVFIKNGKAHLIYTTSLIGWDKLPANSIQVISNKTQYCYNKACKEFKTHEELLNELKYS